MRSNAPPIQNQSPTPQMSLTQIDSTVDKMLREVVHTKLDLHKKIKQKNIDTTLNHL
jgi:hypothetical protein